MIHFLINMEGLHEIEAALGKAKDKSKVVLRKAINDAAKEVEKRMAKGASKRYARNESGMRPYRDVTTISKAKVGNLAAVIRVTDRPSELYDYTLNDRTYYPGSKGAPRWIKGKQLKTGRLLKLAARPNAGRDKYKAFVVEYPVPGGGKHRAIAERVPGSHMADNPNKEKIRSLYGTSKPKAEEYVFKQDIEADIQDMLIRNIQLQIDRFL
jgi:hypothetical protein